MRIKEIKANLMELGFQKYRKDTNDFVSDLSRIIKLCKKEDKQSNPDLRFTYFYKLRVKNITFKEIKSGKTNTFSHIGVSMYVIGVKPKTYSCTVTYGFFRMLKLDNLSIPHDYDCYHEMMNEHECDIEAIRKIEMGERYYSMREEPSNGYVKVCEIMRG